MTTAKLSVPTISCNHCVSAIESELIEMDGIRSVKADDRTKTVTIDWEKPATMENILATLKEINYPAQ